MDEVASVMDWDECVDTCAKNLMKAKSLELTPERWLRNRLFQITVGHPRFANTMLRLDAIALDFVYQYVKIVFVSNFLFLF